MKGKWKRNFIIVVFIITSIFISSCADPVNENNTDNIVISMTSDEAAEKISKIDWIATKGDKIFSYAEDLRSGYLCIGDSVKDKPEYDINNIDNIDWNMQVGSIPNTYQLYLQSLNPIWYLASAYDMTGDPEYMDLGWDFLESWVAYEKNSKLSKDNVYVWDSHGMAMRTENIIIFSLIGIKNDYFNQQQVESIGEILQLHGDYLSNDEYYHNNHNHGVVQDRALITLAYFVDNSKSDEWIDIAKQRLEKQWDFEFTSEMVSTENSFGYHVFNKNLYTNIMQYLQANDDDWGVEKLGLLEKAEDVIGWFVKPNGKSASFGESAVTEYDSVTGREDGVLRYLTSKGTEGVKPDNNSIIYPEAGYYVGREFWDPTDSRQDVDFEDATWVLFKSGFLSNVHKQDDDTSFEFYAKGYDIFVDPGFFGYVSNDLREYLNSTSAHNMVTIDGSTYYGKKIEPGNTGIAHYEINTENPYDYVAAYANIYEDIAQERHMVYLGESLFIYDQALSSKEHIYTQNFQCGPYMEVVKCEDTSVLLKIADTGYYVQIDQLNNNTTCEVLSGTEGSNYGQYSPKTGYVEYIDTIRFTNISENLELATMISIVNQNGECIDFSSYEWDNRNKEFSFVKDGSTFNVDLESV